MAITTGTTRAPQAPPHTTRLRIKGAIGAQWVAISALREALRTMQDNLAQNDAEVQGMYDADYAERALAGIDELKYALELAHARQDVLRHELEALLAAGK